MVQKHKNRIWSLSAFLFLYLGLAVPGPFYFHVSSGFGTFCMFCIETHESVLFNQINLFLRGVLVAGGTVSGLHLHIAYYEELAII